MDSWQRKLRMGMVGGGEGAFIGAVHRLAAPMDGQIEMVAGCFSRDFDNTKRTGAALYLAPDRCYAAGRRTHRFRQYRHPEQSPFRHRQDLS